MTAEFTGWCSEFMIGCLLPYARASACVCGHWQFLGDGDIFHNMTCLLVGGNEHASCKVRFEINGLH